MLITKKELVEMGACRGGLNRFIKQTNNTDKPVEVVSLIGGENTLWDLLWLAANKVPGYTLQSLARTCALSNLEQIKPHLTDDLYNELNDYITNDRYSDICGIVERLCVAMEPMNNADFASGVDVTNYLYRLYRSVMVGTKSTTKGQEKINQILVKLFS